MAARDLFGCCPDPIVLRFCCTMVPSEGVWGWVGAGQGPERSQTHTSPCSAAQVAKHLWDMGVGMSCTPAVAGKRRALTGGTGQR